MSSKNGHRQSGVIEQLESRCLLSLPAPADGGTPFQRVVIDANPGNTPLEKTLLDVNGDGNLDVAIGHDDNTGIYWYAYPASGVVTDTWLKYPIVTTGNCYEDTTAIDVNGDGAVDLIAGYNGGIYWFENPRGSGKDPRTNTWAVHQIGSTEDHDMVVADFDGDGKFDIATNTAIYFQNSPTSWTTISTANYPRIGDGTALLDTGHGKIDLVGIGPNGKNKYAPMWYENPRDHGGNARTDKWNTHVFGSLYDPTWSGGGLGFNSYDVNGDGRMDIVAFQNEQPDDSQPAPPVGISWYEAPVDRINGTWVLHQIDVGITNVHRVRIADANGDGRMEIFYAEQEQSANDRVGILYNVNGDGLSWANQVLYTGSGHNIDVADIDGDGDPDMLNAAHGVYGAAHPIELYIDQRQLGMPQVYTQPVPQSAPVGTPATFSVVATGTAPLSFQWQRNNVDIPGATSAAYTLASASTGDSGANFHVKITNSLGSIISADAMLTVTTAPVYLSSLTPTYAVNGWGPYEKDTSNGEQAQGDGKTITLNGVTYARGLGVHAASELRYSIGGAYDVFIADVGIDDEVGNQGSVDFQVWADGLQIFDSGTVTGSSQTQHISVPISGKNEIRLIVTDAGDGNTDDHSDWANAQIQKNAAVFAVNPITGATINEGGTFSASGSFTDSGAGPWTATVNYGDGTPTAPLALNANKTFSLSHVYADNGNDTVTVVVNNGLNNSQNTGAVKVNNVAPTVSIGSNASSGATFSRSGSFTDPGTLDTFTATVDYADGAGAQPLTLNANKTFSLSHTYGFNGTYAVKVTVTDKDGGVGTSTVNITVTGAQTAGTVYLSTLTPTAASGTLMLDKSAGGNIIKLNGATYTRGLGVTSPSDLTYTLAGNYKTFTATVGVDDEVGTAGSVVFQVYLDGKKVYDSKKIKGGAKPKSISLTVTGKNLLRLVVTDSGDGSANDHADWANALVTTNVAPILVPGDGASPGLGADGNDGAVLPT